MSNIHVYRPQNLPKNLTQTPYVSNSGTLIIYQLDILYFQTFVLIYFFDIQILEESIKDLPPWLLNNHVMSITPLKSVNGLNFKLKGFTKIVSIKVPPLLEQ